MLTFVQPLAALGFLSLVPITLWYFLRQRFKRQNVGSLFLWRQIADSAPRGSRFMWRSVLLLLLQLLVAGALTLSLMGPRLVADTRNAPGVLLVVDTSASMVNVGIEPLRSVLRTELEQLYRPQAGSGTGGTAASTGDLHALTVYLADSGRTPILMLDAQPYSETALDQRISAVVQAVTDRLDPSAARGGFDTDRIAAEVQALVNDGQREWAGLILTDGQHGSFLGALPRIFGSDYRLRLLPPAQPAFGLASFGILDTATDGEVRVEYRLNSEGSADAQLRLLWWPQTTPGGSRNASGNTSPGTSDTTSTNSGASALEPVAGILDPASAVELRTWSHSPELQTTAPIQISGLERGIYALEARQTQTGAGDIRLFAYNPPTPVRVLLVGAETPFLQAALQLDDVSVDLVERYNDQINAALYDLVIAHQQVLPEGVAANIVSFATPLADPSVRVLGKTSGPLANALPADQRSALLGRFLDWSSVQARESLVFAREQDLSVLAQIGGQPAIVAWERQGYKRVNIGIDLYSSDLGFSPVFPAFVKNLLQWAVDAWSNPLAYHYDTTSVSRVATLFSTAEAWWPLLPSRKQDAASPEDLGVPRQAGAALINDLGFEYWAVVNLPPDESVPVQASAGLSNGAVDATGSGAGIGPQVAEILGQLSTVQTKESIDLGLYFLMLAFLLLIVEWALWYGIEARKGVRRAV